LEGWRVGELEGWKAVPLGRVMMGSCKKYRKLRTITINEYDRA